MRSVPPGCAAFFLLPFIGFGFIFSQDVLAKAFSARTQLRRMVLVPARVDSRSVVPIPDTSSFRPSVRYAYEFGGVRLECDHVDVLWSDFYREGEAWDLVYRYVPGQEVTAWVDPIRPSEAVLVRELRLSWTQFIMGFGISTFGALFFIAVALFLKEEPTLHADSNEGRPQFARSLWFPIASGLIWNLIAATGVAALLLAVSAPPALAAAVVVETVIGILLSAWLVRRIQLRSRFLGCRLRVDPRPVGKGTPATWTLEARRLRGMPQFHLVYRDHFHRDISDLWGYQERVCRALQASRTAEGWTGTLTVNPGEPSPVDDQTRYGHWVLRVRSGRDVAYFSVVVARPAA